MQARLRRLSVIIGVAIVALAGVTQLSAAIRDSSLDTTFGVGGKVTMVNTNLTTQPRRVFVQADGKIVIVGVDQLPTYQVFAVWRYNTDGTPDTSFDGDGALVTNDGPNTLPATAESWKGVAVQADGKIVVAGNFGNDFKVARYNTDGTPDTSFDGDGKLTTDIGSSTTDAGRQSDLQADGKIVVAGNSSNDIAIVRYNTDGTLDTSFDGDGKLVEDFGDNSSDSVNGLTIDSDGKIFVAGSFRTSSFQMGLVASYLPSGAVDTEFDLENVTDGSTDTLWAIALQPDGKILATGTYSAAGTPTSAYKGLIFRYNVPTVRPTTTTTTTTTVAPATTDATTATIAATTTAAAPTTAKAPAKKEPALPASGSDSSLLLLVGATLVAVGLVVIARRRLTR